MNSLDQLNKTTIEAKNEQTQWKEIHFPGKTSYSYVWILNSACQSKADPQCKK